MEEIAERINQALLKEEVRAEGLANKARLVILSILALIAILNARSVSLAANIMNLGSLVICYAYGGIVFFNIRRGGYRPGRKYVTSCLDVVLIFLLLFMYMQIEIPTVALKNYVFLLVFPIIGLTVFRYDRRLSWTAGGLAIFLYLGLISYLYFVKHIQISSAGYERELFSGEVTFIGQLTKVLILIVFVALMSTLAQYSRKLFVTMVRDQSTLQRKQELMEWELDLAAHVQQQFFPRRFPSILGLDVCAIVEQGHSVGGDYCDFLKIAEDRILSVAADVSGNGVPAALIMAEVRATIHLLTSMEMDLAQLAQRLNTLLFRSTKKTDFVTLFAAEINTSKHTLNYFTAGHPPALICLEGVVRLLTKGTAPLGVCPSLSNLTLQHEPFLPGSILVTYTDGLLERTNTNGVQYGEERLYDYVRTHADHDANPFAQQLLAEVKKFGSGEGLEDDIGIAVAKLGETL